MTLFSHKVKQLLHDSKAMVERLDALPCVACRENPRWVLLATADDDHEPPPPCPGCGSQDYSIILTGTTRTPGDVSVL